MTRFSILIKQFYKRFYQSQEQGLFAFSAPIGLIKRVVCAIVLTLLFTSSVSAQRKVQGLVIDAATSTPLEGALVEMWNSDFKTTSRADGTFELFFPNNGEMRYTVKLEGYRTVKIKPEVEEKRTIALERKEKKVTKDGTDSLPPLSPLPHNLGGDVNLMPDSLGVLGIQHAAQFLQGQVAGLHVVRPGGNPNEDFLLRLRGLSTFTAQTSPLIVVDGLPETSLYLLDPNDIASIRVLKDAVSTLDYGLRGASGIIEVKTKGPSHGKPRVNYHGFVSQDFIGRRIPHATVEEFVSNGGPDFGGRTDWVGEITRTPISTGHHLSFSGQEGVLGYSAALGYRNANGILKNSGFQQLNGRIGLQFEPWKDRLKLHTQVYGTGRDSEYGLPEAFRYAIMFNPTAPVRSENPAFQPFGGYFQTQAFESINPVAIIEQNKSIGTWRQYGGKAGLDFFVLKNLKFSGFYIRQEHERLGGRYIHPQSLYEAGPFRNGALWQLDDKRTNSAGQLSLSGTFDVQKIGLKIGHRHGFDLQRHSFESNGWQSENVGLINLTYDNLDKLFSSETPDKNFKRGARNIRAYFSSWQVDWRAFYLGAKLRYEGTNIQESHFKHGLFYGLTGGLKLDELLKAENFKTNLRLGFGKTGGLFAAVNENIAIPFFTNAGQPIQAGSEFLPGLNFFGNRDFQWEEKREWNLGTDFSLRWFGLNGTIDFYRNTADGLMTTESFIINNVLLGYIPYNTGKLTNTGLEVSLSMDLVQKNSFTWRSRLNFFTNRTQLHKFDRLETRSEIWVFDGFGLAGSLPPRNLLQEGDRLGQLYGTVFDLVGAAGIPVIKDLNKDNVTDDVADAKVLGQTMPRFVTGWQHSLTYKRLDLTLNFRGVLGHSLGNSYRLNRENTGFVNLNFVKTDRFIPGQRFSGGFMDRYTEKASFITLDYLALGYRIPLQKGNFRLYVAGQHLLTLTSYTGADPEPRLEVTGNPLIMGIENGNTYYRNQTLVAGVQLGF